jgi:peptidoglycan/LPS O-acetylase OafA/YrhL
MGVDLFFALSGFLITTILWRQRSSTSYFKSFYFRRALRIWPLYYFYIGIMYAFVSYLPHLDAYRRLVSHSTYLQEHPTSITTPLVVSLLFLQNCWAPSLFSARDMTSITWSLCIEEQFYLFWPFAIRYLKRKTLICSIAVGLVLEPLMRLFLFHNTHDVSFRVNATTRFIPFHLDSLLAGALLALIWPAVEHLQQTRFVLISMFTTGLALTALTARHFGIFTFTGIAVLSVSIVGLALNGVWHRFTTLRALRFFGTISYGLYLIHPVVFLLLQSRSIYKKLGLQGNLKATEMSMMVGAIAVSVVLATLSRFTFEQYFLNLKDEKSRGVGNMMLQLATSEELTPNFKTGSNID